MRTTELDGFDLHCPYCFGLVMRCHCPREETPHKGDFAFCSQCGQVGVFTNRSMFKNGWRIRKPTYKERPMIAQHMDLALMRANWENRWMH